MFRIPKIVLVPDVGLLSAEASVPLMIPGYVPGNILPAGYIMPPKFENVINTETTPLSIKRRMKF